MGRRRIFTVQTPLGDRVFLTRDRWRQIIRFKHPALAGANVNSVPACPRHSRFAKVPRNRKHICTIRSPRAFTSVWLPRRPMKRNTLS